MKIVDVVQGSDEWLQWRSEGVTATDAVVLSERSPYKTIWRLWAEKTGYAKPVDLSMNPLVRKGKENEDKARQAFEAEIGDLLLPACVQSTVDPLVRTSLDGLTSQKIPVELKCPSEKVFTEVREKGTQSEAYQMYFPQCQYQILATGAPYAFLVFFYEGKMISFRINADRAFLADLYPKVKIFWNSVCNKIEPEKDPKRDLYIPLGDEARQWIAAAEQYRFFEETIRELKAQLVELNSKQKPYLETLKSLMGEYYHADYCGLMVTKYAVKGRVNLTKALADKSVNLTPDELDSYRDDASLRYRVTMDDSVLPRHVVDHEVIAPLVHVQEAAESFYI